LRQAGESCELTKQQVEVYKSETEKEPLHEELATLETQIQVCKAAVAGAKSTQVATMASIFSTVTRFLWRWKNSWDKIVTEQTKKDKWTELHGHEHKGPHCKTMGTFEDCMMLFLKTFFVNNATEDMKFYMTCLKNPNG